MSDNLPINSKINELCEGEIIVTLIANMLLFVAIICIFAMQHEDVATFLQKKQEDVSCNLSSFNDDKDDKFGQKDIISEEDELLDFDRKKCSKYLSETSDSGLLTGLKIVIWVSISINILFPFFINNILPFILEGFGVNIFQIIQKIFKTSNKKSDTSSTFSTFGNSYTSSPVAPQQSVGGAPSTTQASVVSIASTEVVRGALGTMEQFLLAIYQIIINFIDNNFIVFTRILHILYPIILYIYFSNKYSNISAILFIILIIFILTNFLFGLPSILKILFTNLWTKKKSNDSKKKENILGEAGETKESSVPETKESSSKRIKESVAIKKTHNNISITFNSVLSVIFLLTGILLLALNPSAKFTELLIGLVCLSYGIIYLIFVIGNLISINIPNWNFESKIRDLVCNSLNTDALKIIQFLVLLMGMVASVKSEYTGWFFWFIVILYSIFILFFNIIPIIKMLIDISTKKTISEGFIANICKKTKNKECIQQADAPVGADLFEPPM